MANCKVIAMANRKGGAGKTTMTANFGIGLARAYKRVLLIDTDAQASLTLSFGYPKPDELPVTLADVMQSVIDDAPIQTVTAFCTTARALTFCPRISHYLVWHLM